MIDWERHGFAGFILIVAIVWGCLKYFYGIAYDNGFNAGIARANAIARDEHAADGFHVSEDTQP